MLFAGDGIRELQRREEQYLFTAVLRPGNAAERGGDRHPLAHPAEAAAGLSPGAPASAAGRRICGPALLTFLDAMSVEYVVAMAQNAVLNRLAEPAMRQARKLSEESGQTEHLYGEGRYAAESWLSERRVIFKAEVVRQRAKSPKDNPRFLITNLKQSPRWIYEQVYCERGEIENRLKELHDLEIDRTSCSISGPTSSGC